MSLTRQRFVPAGMMPARTSAQGLGEVSYYDGENRPVTGRAAVPLRELVDDRLLDALLERSKDEAGGLRLTGEGSMLGELVKAVLERALEAELTAHLGYERHNPAGHHSGNSRNGAISKKVQTWIGPVGLEVSRDRAGSFEPTLMPKRSGRVSGGLDDMIISVYAHGMTVCDILHHLKQVYGTDLSHEQVSRITDRMVLYLGQSGGATGRGSGPHRLTTGSPVTGRHRLFLVS
jgi:putative transposase